KLGPDRPTGELVLTGEIEGLRVRKTLTFHANTYTIDTKVRVENASGAARQASLAFPWTTLQEWEGKTAKFLGQHPTTIAMSAGGLRAAPTIPAGGAWEGDFVVYAGPKEYQHLHGVGLEESINFGGFPLPRECGGLPMKWFAVPILSFMNWLYAHVHNYGVAIILLTVLSKVFFYPLTVWSMRSMKSMQRLQPQVNALRSKYKSDPQRAKRETMELYRKHGVHPVGGWLPMLPQIPIFYALYLAVANSAELQNAPFLCFDFLQPVARAFRAMGASWVDSLWICNLADIDPLYILPLVMGVTMFVQQK